MGHRTAVRLAVLLMAAAAWAQDPAALLEHTRDKVLAEAPNLSNYVCTETIERRYYSRQQPPEDQPDCERILLDRKKGNHAVKLDAADRLRVAVSIHGEREIYSWTGAAPYRHGVEDILQSGPIGAGAFAAHLLDIFRNPSVLFRLMGERSDALEYGFRVPIEASRFVVAARNRWLPAGYTGSVHIDKDSLDLRQVHFETNELPPETLLCEDATTLDFPPRQAAGSRWFLPSRSVSHDIMRDTTETDRSATLSDCREPDPSPSSRNSRPDPIGAPPPPDLKIWLELAAPIDTDVAAAGDPVEAIVAEPVFADRRTKEPLIPRGATVAGRIVRMRRQYSPGPLFLVGIAFETIAMHGVTAPFYARLIAPPPATETPLYRTMELTGHGLKDWPHGFLGFAPHRPDRGLRWQADRLVIEPEFRSRWLTVAPPAR